MRNHVQLADAYYRLSDEERKYGESASITNQRTIVREYCEKHGIILVEEFADDGYSGGNFERHVALYIGNGQMIDAPSPGLFIRFDTITDFIGGGSPI